MSHFFSRFFSGMAAASRSGLASTGRRLAGDRRGATAVTLALSLVPLVLATGGGIDFYKNRQKQQSLQAVADAAVLAGSITADEGGDGVATTKTYVTKNYDQPNGVTSTKVVVADANKMLLTADLTATTQTNFLRLVGITDLTVRAKSAATWGGQLMEVAVAIDVTASMDGTKMSAAKTAAKDLVKTLFTVPGTSKTNDKVKMSLVPFNSYVNIGTSYRGQPWLDVANDSTWTSYDCWDTWPGSTCTGYRHVSTTCYNDGVPYACEWDECTGWTSVPAVKVCAWNTHTSAWNGCVGSRNYPADLQAEATSASKVPGLMDTWCNGTTLIRLTDKQGTLNSAISGISPDGNTYIAPGMLWAWRTLSSKGPFADGSADAKATKKAIVLMTDGANTLSASYPKHDNNDVADANSILQKTCTNAKADGIAIFTIAYEVTDATIKSVLTNCASAPSYFFDSSNASEMAAAFSKIGAMLTARRLVY